MNSIVKIINNAINEHGLSITGGGKVVLSGAAIIDIKKMIAECYEVKAKKRNWCGVPCEWEEGIENIIGPIEK